MNKAEENHIRGVIKGFANKKDWEGLKKFRQKMAEKNIIF